MGHHHHHHLPTGTAERKKTFVLVIFFNATITIVEYAGGILSGSLALISDATHNLSDVLALLLGYLGEKLMQKEPDLDFSFGLRRIEVVTALINSLALVGIGAYILFEAVQRWLDPQPIDTGIMLPVAVIGLLGNLFSIIILNRNKAHNLNMKAAFLHMLFDAISSLAVIVVGLVLIFRPIAWLDPLISLVIVVMIAASSFGIIRQSLRIFLQVAPGHIDTTAVRQAILEASGAFDLHGLHIWSVNSSEIFLSCHLCLETLETDDVIRRVNAMLASRFDIRHTTIQVEKNRTCALGQGICCGHKT